MSVCRSSRCSIAMRHPGSDFERITSKPFGSIRSSKTTTFWPRPTMVASLCWSRRKVGTQSDVGDIGTLQFEGREPVAVGEDHRRQPGLLRSGVDGIGQRERPGVAQHVQRQHHEAGAAGPDRTGRAVGVVAETLHGLMDALRRGLADPGIAAREHERDSRRGDTRFARDRLQRRARRCLPVFRLPSFHLRSEATLYQREVFHRRHGRRHLRSFVTSAPCSPHGTRTETRQLTGQA